MYWTRLEQELFAKVSQDRPLRTPLERRLLRVSIRVALLGLALLPTGLVVISVGALLRLGLVSDIGGILFAGGLCLITATMVLLASDIIIYGQKHPYCFVEP